jgi:hypothetical protein
VSGSIRWETVLEAGGGAFCREGGQWAGDRFGVVLTHDRRGSRRAAVGRDRQGRLGEAWMASMFLMRMNSGVVGSPDENGASDTLSTRTFSSSPRWGKQQQRTEPPSCRCVHEPGTG